MTREVYAVSRNRRSGLRSEPPGGWPLDDVFVGVATLRTIRELFEQHYGRFTGPLRAWDLALWSGVTPQGTANSLERLDRVGLVWKAWRGGPGYAARYQIDTEYPLFQALDRLFTAERLMADRNERSPT